MIYRLYSIYDNVSLSYGPPSIEVSDAAASRMHRTVINNPQAGLLYRFPSDYDLYYLGTYDNDTGYVVPQVPPQLVVKGGAVIDHPHSVSEARPVDQD